MQLINRIDISKSNKMNKPAQYFSFFLVCLMCLVSYSHQKFQDSTYDKDTRLKCISDLDFHRLTKRIVGGCDAKLENFRFVVQLLVNNRPKCGATLITDKHVLTAAHCLYGKNGMRNIEVFSLNIGDYDDQATDEVKNYHRKVSKIVKAVGFNPKFDNDYDIAILEFEDPVPLGRMLRVALLPPYKATLPSGTTCNVWGWGRTSATKNIYPKVLQQVEISILPKDCCEHELIPKGTAFCAGGKGSQDSCIGDSGGSILVRVNNAFVACGITSFGECGVPGLPGFYTDVSKYTGWIYEETKSANCKPVIIPRKDYPSD